MDKQTQNNINKDLILRERLAIERTVMGNDRTLLAFIRTSLYFAIAGMSVNSLLKVTYGMWFEIAFWIIAPIILIIGLLKYSKQKKSLKNSEMHIGDYKLNWADDNSSENE
jgi:putative membrane protein